MNAASRDAADAADATDVADATKRILHRYLKRNRDQLAAKLDGLGERDIRRPLVRTGTNLLGLIKHVAGVQLGYFGETFGRPANIELPWFDEGAPLDADMWATADESRAQIMDVWRRSAEHADATIEALDLYAHGVVPWWPAERRDVTLDLVLVHMTAEMARHAGHADIVRELIDGRAGNNDGNFPEQPDDAWAAHFDRIQRAAEEAAERYE